MKTKSNSTIYYLYFASQKPAAADIVSDIFGKYRAEQGFEMATNSHIEWTDATWNPVTGCSKISPAANTVMRSASPCASRRWTEELPERF